MSSKRLSNNTVENEFLDNEKFVELWKGNNVNEVKIKKENNHKEKIISISQIKNGNKEFITVSNDKTIMKWKSTKGKKIIRFKEIITCMLLIGKKIILCGTINGQIHVYEYKEFIG
eukprot:TRINITY_DN7764_c0_g1_i1.p1 TRINITY_DN7764_c0_g1~~TRINITY_DN7764_c0_g1_i1.p1  ORF type:complete len:116 (-),score=18.64 TRINITY_DN7764_c0_g1_i1:98-445(-)